MVIKCNKCKNPAVIYLAYGKHSLCIHHFNDFFEKRFRKTIRMYNLVRNRDYIGIATSGGKDSMVLLYLMNKIYKKAKIKMCAIFVDEGTPGYSNKTKEIVEKFCKKEKIKLVASSHKKEFGISTGEIAERYNKKEGTLCTYCGVLRRDTINRLAEREKVTKVATGHNLDDEAQTVLMNMFTNDAIRLFRTGPLAGIIDLEEEIRPRIKPLYLTPEKEIAAYALYNNIPFHDCNCPFFSEAKRNVFRSILNELEVSYPGSKFGLIRSFLKLKETINIDKITTNNHNKSKIRKCKICNNISSQDICASCRLLKELKIDKHETKDSKS